MGHTKRIIEELSLQEMIMKMYQFENADDDYQYEKYRDLQNEMLERDMENFFNSFHNER